MSRHGDRRGQIADFRDSFETINWLYLLFTCGIKTKTHFEWLLSHWSSLGQLNLEPTRPNGLVGCKVPTDLVKISVKEATHMGFYYITSHYSTPGRLMKTTAVVFIRQGDRQRYRDFPHWFMWEVVIFRSSDFAHIQIMTPRVRYQRHGSVRWIFIEKLVIEISRWWRPLETGMKTTGCVAWDLMTTIVVD